MDALMTFHEWSVFVLVSLGAVAVLMGCQTRIPREDRPYLWTCLVAHLISSVVLIWLTYDVLGGGDIEKYYYYGDRLAEYLWRDPWHWGPEFIGLILQDQDVRLPMDIFGHVGSSTTSMIGMCAFLMAATGSSELGTGAFFSVLAFSGQAAMYVAFRGYFSGRYRTRLVVAILLVPSAVFWTSGVVKEAVAIAGLGWMVWAFYRWQVRGRWKSAVVVGGMGTVMVAVAKSYVLFPFAIAAGVWWFWQRSLAVKGSVAVAAKPLYLVGAAVMAVVAMVGLGALFPQYSLDSLAEETAELQYQGQRVEGGSSYAIGNPDETSLGGQLAFAPVALTASLFRPFVWEAHNAVALINGVEMAIILWCWVFILWRRGLHGTWRAVSQSPPLMFCLVFVLLFGLGVGLATTNLGTLSRYRVPMMPMYALILMMLYPRKR